MFEETGVKKQRVTVYLGPEAMRELDEMFIDSRKKGKRLTNSEIMSYALRYYYFNVFSLGSDSKRGDDNNCV